MRFQFTLYKFAVLVLVIDISNLMNNSGLGFENTIKIERFTSLIYMSMTFFILLYQKVYLPHKPARKISTLFGSSLRKQAFVSISQN